MKCPFRMKAFDQPDTCDPECACLAGVLVGGEVHYVCAFATVAWLDKSHQAGVVNDLEGEKDE